MKRIIVGTAGHVDHGKTTLVKALTGKDTDRLREEKERGISIELGFAPLTLPNGTKIGLVDVPGHEKFLKNMLAGVSGIDLVLLLIASDEGIMPQTKEHLDIINLLKIPKGIVVLTKIDMVEQDWLDLMIEEVREFLEGTQLEKAPLVPVSGHTGQGVPELLSAIEREVAELEEKNPYGKLRVPVDRVFSITGFGTVITGTLAEGKVAIGEEVEILPEGLTSRVRSIQVHGEKVEQAFAGQRVAINLPGVETQEIAKGSVVAKPKYLVPSFRMDLHLELLASADKEITNRQRVRLHIGTQELIGRLVILDNDKIEPGDKAFVQILLEEEGVAGKGERFVLRSYSPVVTIGGGVVINPNPEKHKRFKQETLSRLKSLLEGTPEELVLSYLQNQTKALLSVSEIANAVKLELGILEAILLNLAEQQSIQWIIGDKVKAPVASQVFEEWSEVLTKTIEKHLMEFPLRFGYTKEEVRSRVFSFMNSKQFNALLEQLQSQGRVEAKGQFITLPGYSPKLTPELDRLINGITQTYLEAKLETPSWKEVVAKFSINSNLAMEIQLYLLSSQALVKISEDNFVHSKTFDDLKEQFSKLLANGAKLTLAEFRDALNSSRKYVLPLLEYFDQIKFTRRVEDFRMKY